MRNFFHFCHKVCLNDRSEIGSIGQKSSDKVDSVNHWFLFVFTFLLYIFDLKKAKKVNKLSFVFIGIIASLVLLLCFSQVRRSCISSSHKDVCEKRRIKRCVSAVCILFLVSCSQTKQSPTVGSSIKQEYICTLSDTIAIGRPNSMTIVDANSFVVCDNSKVYQFDFTGKFIRHIGAPGRSTYEYLQPMCVRTFNGSIYVWSSWITKII